MTIEERVDQLERATMQLIERTDGLLKALVLLADRVDMLTQRDELKRQIALAAAMTTTALPPQPPARTNFSVIDGGKTRGEHP